MSRSQAPLCLYTLRMITDHAEGTFESLRYSLGGDRPSQTAYQTLFQKRLDSNAEKGGLSWSTPPRLAPELRSLPPITTHP